MMEMVKHSLKTFGVSIVKVNHIQESFLYFVTSFEQQVP